MIRKWRLLIGEVVASFGTKHGILGATILEVASNGNALLQLNKDYALGSKGTVLEIPQDKKIFETVRRKGMWELEESEWLARGLTRAFQGSDTQKVVLIDIGANTGLVALQALNLSKTNPEVFLFEPVPRHASAIRRNLTNFPNIHVNEFALSDKNGQADTFTQATNHGNTSLLNSVVPGIDVITTRVQLVETATYCNKYLKNFDRYVIKSDTQGMDALILSRIPLHIWQKCESAVIEVWALNEISERHVEELLSMWGDFGHVDWHPNTRKSIELREVREFWLGKSGSSRNLFLSNNSFRK
jgi:FkbM family methyltransferase